VITRQGVHALNEVIAIDEERGFVQRR